MGAVCVEEAFFLLTLEFFGFPYPCVLLLCVSGCSGLTDASILSIGSGLFSSTLLSLDVSHVYQLTDVSNMAFETCSSLQELNLKKCLRFTDQVWKILLGGQIKKRGRRMKLPLRVIDLSGCQVTDGGIRKLHTSWMNVNPTTPSTTAAGGSHESHRISMTPSNCLDSFDVSDVVHPTPPPSISSSSLVHGLNLLHTLSLNECHNLTDAGFELLLPLCTQLETIHLVGCHRITNHTLTIMAKYNGSL